MARQYRPPIAALLLAVLLFSSGLASGNRFRKTNQFQPTSTSEEQLAPENFNEDQMRMIDGDVAKQNQYPYMVALMLLDNETQSYDFQCGGSLISSTQILTAAHCVCIDDTKKIIKPNLFKISLGVHFFNATVNDAQLTKRIRRIKIHEKFNPITYFNDIAILTLTSPVKFTETISPVCLPSEESNEQYVNQLAIVKGWGTTSEGGNGSDVLLHTVLTIIPNSKCQSIYIPDYKITKDMMCAYRRGKDTCQGDSGGPLVIESDDLNVNNELNAIESGDNNVNNEQECPWIQVGIVSFGTGCGVKGIPGVYTRITSFLTWIKSQKI